MGKSNKTIECSLVNRGFRYWQPKPNRVTDGVLSTQSPSLNGSYWQDINHWPHLMGIDLPRIEAEIGLLIGSDVPRAMKPKEVRQSNNGGPFAMRTILGWMLSGPLGRKETKYPRQTSLPLWLTSVSTLKISVT